MVYLDVDVLGGLLLAKHLAAGGAEPGLHEPTGSSTSPPSPLPSPPKTLGYGGSLARSNPLLSLSLALPSLSGNGKKLPKRKEYE